MSIPMSVVVLAALQGPAQFAVAGGADTAWVPAGTAIEVVMGSEVTLLPALFDSAGGRVATEAAWWHSGDNPFFQLETDGTFDTLSPGEDRVMFHWTGRDGADAGADRNGMVWVVIRVVPEDGG